MGIPVAAPRGGGNKSGKDVRYHGDSPDGRDHWDGPDYSESLDGSIGWDGRMGPVDRAGGGPEVVTAGRITAGDAMIPVIGACINPGDTLRAAATKLIGERSHFIPVVDGFRRPVAVITCAGIVRAFLDGLSPETSLSEVDYLLEKRFTCFQREQDFDPLSGSESDHVLVCDQEGKLIGTVPPSRLLGICRYHLKESKGQVWELEAIVESIYDGIGVCDDQGRIVRVNEGYHRVTGLTPEEGGAGRMIPDLLKEGLLSDSVALEVLRTGKPYTKIQRFKSGKEVLASATPLFSPDGKLLRAIVNFRDLTELNDLKAQWEKSRELNVRYRLELEELRAKALALEEVVAESRAMRSIIDLATRIALVESTVLITGESGVGKEVVAKVIHRTSRRRNGPFVLINCGAIPETLLESELFGYERGAFTGAAREGKPGLFEMADQGTIVLDEIGEMPLNLQVKLLRVIDQQEVMRIGGTRPIRLNVRIIAATNSDLEARVKKGTFRKDLFYRLNVVPIHVPPLRERREDIVPLALHFTRRFNRKYTLNKKLSPELLKALERHDWPGNVRELENMVERFVVMSESEIMRAEDFLVQIDGWRYGEGAVTVNQLIPLRNAHELVERELIRRALVEHKSVRKSAKALGIGHATMLRRLSKYGFREHT